MKMHSLEVDFCVIGGGLAGVCAAIAAARLGARVALVQDRSVLGGNASSEVRMHVVGADCHVGRPGARETGLIEELRLEESTRNLQRSYSQWDLLLYEKVISEPGITLLLNATCVGCSVEASEGGRTIRSARVIRPSMEEEFEISARFFADCSGDGRLGLEAGADFRMGREGRDEFGEDKAVPQTDQHTLGSSIMMTARRHETPQPFSPPDWARRFGKDDFAHRPISSYEYGHWWAEWGGQLDTITDNDRIRHELLRIALGIWNYIKNSGDHPDSAHWALDWVGAIPGKRESRRFLGPHILTQGDIEEGRVFDDQVAYGGWWLDLHPPTGIDAVEEPACVQHHIPHLYSIPLRALYSRNVGNLFFAGRNISATHVAFASTRVMATCAVMGQAVGTAAALLRDRQGSIAEAANPDAVRLIQQTLLREDAFLPDLAGDDQDDAGRSALPSASSEQADSPAAAVLNGITRRIEPSWGPWARAGKNHWESSSLPAWLELSWDVAQSLGEVHLTFCSGLERELTLTPSDHLTSRIVRGAQPETIRDYDLVLDGKKILEIRGNYLRKRKHRLPPGTQGKALRIDVLATHGLPTARIFEVRAYA